MGYDAQDMHDMLQAVHTAYHGWLTARPEDRNWWWNTYLAQVAWSARYGLLTLLPGMASQAVTAVHHLDEVPSPPRPGERGA